MDRDNEPERTTYVLRCWRETDEVARQVAWRFTLENVSTNRRRGFADTPGLLNFLQEQFIEAGENDRSTGAHT